MVYKAEHDCCRRFPEPASGTLRNGVSRNPSTGLGTLSLPKGFQVFDPLDFLAEVTQHIPEPGEHTIRYYGWYSNKSRGMRAKVAQGELAAAPTEDLGEADALFRSRPKGDGRHACAGVSTANGNTCRSRWAAMIKRVYEVDPLKCPRCGGQMRIVAFVEARTQADVIERILRHCGLWTEPRPRAPPKFTLMAGLDPESIPIDEFLANF